MLDVTNRIFSSPIPCLITSNLTIFQHIMFDVCFLQIFTKISFLFLFFCLRGRLPSLPRDFTVYRVTLPVLRFFHCERFRGWEFTHSLIANSLISLRSNERLWAIRSDHSRKMSDREWIGQVAQDNEQSWANRSGCSWQMSDRERFAKVANDKWVNERFTKTVFG